MSRPDPFQTSVPIQRRHALRSSRTIEDYSGDHTNEPLSLATLKTQRSVFLMFAFFFVILFLLLVRLFQLQMVRGAEYRAVSEGNRVRTIVTPAPRGTIIDRTGAVLAANVPNIAVTIIPADLPKTAAERHSLYEEIGAAIGMPSNDIALLLQTQLRRTTDPVTIKEHIPYSDAIQYIVATSDIPAVSVIALPNREYPAGKATASILGYTGRISAAELEQSPAMDALDIIGKTGLEQTYNTSLTGLDGIRQVERDVNNREQRLLSQRDPQPGQTVVTTIDMGLQQVLYDRLSAMVSSIHSPGGAAIALDPNNGDILALANAPSYDNNWFVTAGHAADVTNILTDAKKPLLNRVVSGQYPSGSIIKPLLATAALTEGTITPTTTVNSVGGFKVGNDFFPDWKVGGHGVTNVIKALAESVNTFFYAVGGGFDTITGLGVDRMVTWLQRFGWGQKLGIDLPGEAKGFLPTKEWRQTKRPSPWKLGDTYHLSIGQGDLEVTPLQVAAAYVAIANGGTLYEPHLVSSLKNPDGTVVSTIKPHIVADHVAPISDLATVQAGMRAGVLSGSSRSLQSLPVTSAGKTGTAQFGTEGKTHSWYAAYAPYDHPSIVIVVLVEAGGEGNTAALPVAKDVLQWYFTSGAGKP